MVEQSYTDDDEAFASAARMEQSGHNGFVVTERQYCDIITMPLVNMTYDDKHD